MKGARALALLLALAPLPASAGLTESQLASVEFAPPVNARVPLDLNFSDASGHHITLRNAINHRPALLLPLDYRCRTTCGPALSIISLALGKTGLHPGEDFRLILVGLDPASTADEARIFSEAQVGDAKLLAATSILTASAASISALTHAVGYTYVRDADNKAFAHPTGLIALTADGHVVRALSSLGLDATNLRLALTEASEGRIGGVLGRLALICYGFDAVHGIYTSAVERLLMLGGVLTVLSVAGAIAAMSLIARRKRANS
jgi:protein SCO1/2